MSRDPRARSAGGIRNRCGVKPRAEPPFTREELEQVRCAEADTCRRPRQIASPLLGDQAPAKWRRARRGCWKPKYLREFARWGDNKVAARLAGVSRATVDNEISRDSSFSTERKRKRTNWLVRQIERFLRSRVPARARMILYVGDLRLLAAELRKLRTGR